MTVPLVVANHKPIEYAAKLKKFYNTLYNAVEMAENDYDASLDVLLSMASDSATFFSEYLADYIKYTKIVTSGTTTFRTYYTTGYANASSTNPVYYLDDGTSFYYLSNNGYTNFCGGGSYKCTNILYDVNGDKQPNNVGRDQFVFSICRNRITTNPIKAKSFFGLSPHSCYPRSTLQTECASNNYINISNGSCTALVKMDGWEFKKDSGSGDGYPIKL